MSVPSFIGFDSTKAKLANHGTYAADDRVALIGLQALTLNLASANQRQSTTVVTNQTQLKKAPTNQRRPVVTNQQSISASAPLRQKRYSPKTDKRLVENSTSLSCLEVPQSASRVRKARASGSSVSSEHSCPMHQRGQGRGLSHRQFTNNINLHVKSSDGLESMGGADGDRSIRSASGQSGDGTRPKTPKPRHGAAQSRQNTPQSRQNTPRSRQNTPQSRAASSNSSSDHGRPFPEHWSVHQVQEGLKKGQVVEGVLRINPKNYRDAYISAPDELTDICIAGVYDRNRALSGDTVAIQLYTASRWQVLDQALISYLHLHGSIDDLRQLFPDPSSLRTVLPLLDRLLPSNDRFPRPLHSALSVSPPQPAESEEKLSVVQRLIRFPPPEQQNSTAHQPSSSVSCQHHVHASAPQGVECMPPDHQGVTALANLSLSNVKSQDCLGGQPTARERKKAEDSSSRQVGSKDSHPEHKSENTPSSEGKSQVAHSDQNKSKDTPPKQVMTKRSHKEQEKSRVTPSKQVTSKATPVGQLKRKDNAANQMKKEGSSDQMGSSECVAGGRARLSLGVSLESAVTHSEWGRFVQRTGRVVAITRAAHSRRTIGSLFPLTGDSRSAANGRWRLFRPRDSRMPRMRVQCAGGLAGADDETSLFLAQLSDWPAVGRATGTLCQCFGEVGAIDVEMRALLAQYDIEDDEEESCEAGEQDQQWSVSEQDRVGRRSLLDLCVFTIDPSTARDLDDAVSCRALPVSGDSTRPLYELGVHIADVSHFVAAGSELDLRAARRSTSVYLPQRVIPMLPRRLCERACSLQPAVERLAVSVLLVVDGEGRVAGDTWFGRTVIRSCCQLAYEHAQLWIDDADRAGGSDDSPPPPAAELFPTVHGPQWSLSDVRHSVLLLHRMAQARRAGREQAGALRLDQQRVGFTLDAGLMPVGFSLQRHLLAHELIEEMMLLANMSVAERLVRVAPWRAVLRRHPPPNQLSLSQALRQLASVGVLLRADCSGDLHRSLRELSSVWTRQLGPAAAADRMNVVVTLLSSAMNQAVYYRAGTASSNRHYALSVDCYTHFTSPIRRYPDILVHRLLLETLSPQDSVPPLPVADEQQQQAVSLFASVDNQLSWCNERREAVRSCADRCCEVLLSKLASASLDDEGGGRLERWGGLVSGVLDGAVDVLVSRLALVKRVYLEQMQGVEVAEYRVEHGAASWHLTWASCPNCGRQQRQQLQLLSDVSVRLTSDPFPRLLALQLLPPVCDCLSSQSLSSSPQPSDPSGSLQF